jgi:hypothetical protein
MSYRRWPPPHTTGLFDVTIASEHRHLQGKLGNSAKIVDCTGCGNLDEAFANARYRSVARKIAGERSFSAFSAAQL